MLKSLLFFFCLLSALSHAQLAAGFSVDKISESGYGDFHEKPGSEYYTVQRYLGLFAEYRTNKFLFSALAGTPFQKHGGTFTYSSVQNSGGGSSPQYKSSYAYAQDYSFTAGLIRLGAGRCFYLGDRVSTRWQGMFSIGLQYQALLTSGYRYEEGNLHTVKMNNSNMDHEFVTTMDANTTFDYGIAENQKVLSSLGPVLNARIAFDRIFLNASLSAGRVNKRRFSPDPENVDYDDSEPYGIEYGGNIVHDPESRPWYFTFGVSAGYIFGKRSSGGD
jgi:hypothetical protein